MASTIEDNVAYMTIRMLLWFAAAAAQLLLLSKWASTATQNPLTLGYLIAGAIGLAGIRDVWLLILATSKSIAAEYIAYLLDSAALGAFMVCALCPCTTACGSLLAAIESMNTR